MKSIFTDKFKTPTSQDLEIALGATSNIWQHFSDFTKTHAPAAIEEWMYSSEKFGWSFRLKDKKRVLIYLLPRDQFFKVAFVFGEQATTAILESTIVEHIKNDIKVSRKYAEGRGIRIDITNQTLVSEIEKLIAFKVAH
jgi:hypothetical protein